MRFIIARLSLVCLFVVGSHASFLASAVQFRSVDFESPSKTLTANAQRMATIISNIAGQGSLLISFPEFSLLPPSTPHLPSPFSLCSENKTAFSEYCEKLHISNNQFECNSTAFRPPLGILSCASSLSPQVAISYNTCEVTDDGQLYNTQVILRGGKILTSYRKLHPWYTDCFDTPELQLRTFDVNGSAIGLFTCKDILYHDPKGSLLAAGIRVFSAIDIVAHELVQGFALVHNVTVVSSDRDPSQTQIVAGYQSPVDCSESKTGECVATALIEM